MLESGMDFRENWFAHFKREVDLEVAAHGDVVAGQTALANNIEKKRETVYQHYGQKSGKVYPTVEMMVMLEKKYARGRPVGWSSQPLAEPSQRAPVEVDVASTLAHLVDVLRAIPNEKRELVAQQLLTLARAPDSNMAMQAARDLLTRDDVQPPSPEISAAAEQAKSPEVKAVLMKGGKGKTTVSARYASLLTDNDK